MAGNIKGITIEFRGDTTRLDKALRTINNSTKAIDKELRKVDKALKFNPTSVDLWRQKQTLLSQKITETKSKLDTLKQAQAKMDADGVDKNSQEYRELQREIIETESKLKRFQKQLAQVGNAKLHALGEQFKQIGKVVTDVGKKMTMYITTPLAAAGATAVKGFAEVDKIMQLTNATMGNSKEQAKMLDQAMKDAAANSIYGMQDAAQATLNYARAGLTAEEAAAALAPAMNLAAGEGGNLDTVSAGLVATINGFHGSFDDAASYADVLANACNNSALDVDSLSESMSIAAPIFAAAGYSVQDAALYMGVMANNGIDANKAATSLKTGLARLVSPSKEGADWMDKLNFSITNADGTMKDSVTVQSELASAFSTLSESEQIAAASAIFGKNQMAPWLALINTAPGDVAKLNEQLSVTGTTNEMAAAMMSGFGGALEKLKSSVDVAKTSLGEALAPIVLKVAEGIQSLVDWFNNLSPEAQRIVAVVGTIVAAIGPLLVIIGTLATGIGNLLIFGPMILSTIGGVLAAIGPVIAIILGVVAAGIVLYKNWDVIKAKAIEIWSVIQEKFEGIRLAIQQKIEAVKLFLASAWEAIKTAAGIAWNIIKMAILGPIGPLVYLLKNNWTQIKTAASTVWNSIKATASAVWNGIKTAITSPIQTAVNTVRGLINKIKNFFPLKIGRIFTGLKLPHFKIDGGSAPFGIGGKGKKPSISVDWYKRAMDNPYMFSTPTFFGAGEAGDEILYGRNSLMRDISAAVSNANAGGGDEITINVYASQGMDVKELAAEVERRLIESQKRRTLAWQ